MAISNKTKQLTNNYISQKLADPEEKITKVTKLENAGYTTITASKNNMETGAYYNQVATAILNKTGTVATLLIASIEEDVSNGKLENYDLNEKVKILKTMVQINSTLMPSFTSKQKTDTEVDGTRTSVWKTIKTGGN